MDGAIKGLVKGLDPHSEYLDAQGFKTLQEEALGQFGGLGVQVAMEQGLLKIVRPIPQSRAAKSGLRPGDIILRLNDQPITGLTIGQIVARMRGPVDSMVRVAIRRKDQSAPIELLVGRDLIRVDTVSSRIVSGNVGYTRITKFNDLTTEGLQRALEDIWARVPGNRLKGFVLDLRNNPGGLLEQAISVSKAFLDSGTIVSIYGRNIEDNKTYVTSVPDGDLGKGRPLIVLINGGSASASEIVAGALQDNARATILGTRSFGKGSVQSILPIGGGGALKLTTGLYYTPSGRSIQAKGIAPDIEVTQEGRESQTLVTHSEAALTNHLRIDGDEQTGSDTFIPSDPKYDRALQMAVDLLQGTKTHRAFPAGQSSAPN
jgi:carboxyl-terminal processing protease